MWFLFVDYKIEGVVVVKFVVTEDGSLHETEVVKSLGSGCDEEALRLVQSMNDMPEKWIPGIQKGKPVKVYFNLPIRFRLEK